MASSSQSSSAGGGGTMASNPRVWIIAGITVAGVIVLAEVARRRRRWRRGMPGAPPDAGSFCDRFELSPPPQAPPPAARHLLSGLTFAASDNFEIEGYVAGFGNPDWKRTHEAARHTAVVVTTLRKQGGTCVGRTIMDELGFGVTGENLHCGTPINPASPSLVPGGSCSGSAVAVAAQLVDFAIGTDTIGDDTGILVLPTTAGYPLNRNSKERLSSGFEDRMYKFAGIAALSGCCEVTIPMANLDHHLSLSFVAAHGSDKFLLRTILDTYSVIQDQVVLASKLVTAPVTNVSVDVDASESLKEKGNSAFKGRQWSKAIEYYSEAISLNDRNATYYCNRAAAYLELGRFKQAEADCDQALLLDRKNVKAYLRRGFAKQVTLNYKEALQDFRHALALEPQNKTALAAERRLQKLLK